MNSNIYIVDSGFFIEYSGSELMFEVYTTNYVEREVKSHIAKMRFEYLKNIKRLKVITMSEKEVHEVFNEIKKPRHLSETDISLIALCLKFKKKGYNPILITNDRALQYVAKHLNIKILSIGGKFIK